MYRGDTNHYLDLIIINYLVPKSYKITIVTFGFVSAVVHRGGRIKNQINFKSHWKNFK